MVSKKVIKSSIIVMFLIIVGKVLALIRDALIAAKFGATYITDVYNFALGMVYLLTTVSYGLTTTFIPIHTEHLQDNDKKEKNKFVNNVINISSIVTIIITLILVIFAKYIIYIFGHGFVSDPKVFEISIEVTRIMLLSLIFVSLQSVLAGALQCHKKFFEPAAMAMVSNLVYIIYLIYFTAKFGIKGFAIATVVAFFMQFIINIPQYKKLGYKYRLTMNFKDKKIHNMFKLMIPVVISTSVVQLNTFVNRSFATSIFFGAVTILDCANKINTLAYEVFAIGIAMIVYPTLSELAAKENKTEYKKALGKSINTIMIIMIPAAVAIGILRDPLTILIFKRGAFSNEAANLTASALLYYCPAMVAYGVRDILNKAFYAVKDTSTPMINSFIGILINIVINILIVKYMKVSGLTLATTISAIITTLLMMYNLNKKLNGIELKKIFTTFLKIVFSSIVMGFVLILINKISIEKFGHEMKGSLISIFVSLLFGSITYFTCLYIVKIEEYKYLVEQLKNKIHYKK
ncbi:murein biosynthesis integral membrane protein MurJ [Clostridium sp. DJ247]|uniref:murein biosynthesis integral membrane protein MurJ n=1 Tax=Clostridium sp. DJ247 TaxID=2726188 RepID=UPI0016283685|nr:murein biosynthesis integral membrane protein MurJ [Clostridium sp. DJ247]MBC2580238.1 murein biosynthesis integral membrane protein MurJ [Clostridium sp. DJ247]